MAKRRTTKYIVVHCSDTFDYMDIGLEEIRQWHVKDNGWSDIGYHYIIRRNGEIEFGRPESQIGAHSKARNRDSIAICLIGGKPEFNFTDIQMERLRELVEEIQLDFNNSLIVSGHNEFDNKRCPTFRVHEWYENDEIIKV